MSFRHLRSAVGVAALLVCGSLPLSASYMTRFLYPFDIGDARSLPWGADVAEGKPDYDRAAPLPDVKRLLTPATPVVVRIETLRRAVLYAGRDRATAQRLLALVRGRTEAGAASAPDAFAFLDAAVATALVQQLGEHSNPPFAAPSRTVRGLAPDDDAEALVRKALQLRTEDPAFHFAAALVVGARRLGSQDFVAHATRAREGADREPFLARNLGRIYADRLLELEGGR